MHVEFNLPTVAEPRAAISSYWSRRIFGGQPSQDPHVDALASTCMRLVEAAVAKYGLAASALRQFFNDHSSLGLGAMHRATAHFEACVTDMHRAINVFRRLRNTRDRDPLAVYLAEVKPSFVDDRVATPVRNMRDAIHHFQEKLDKGQFAEGEPIAVKPDGPEDPHPSQEGQTIKTCDRLVIGSHELPFVDIADCLKEMSSAASRIAEFDPSKV